MQYSRTGIHLTESFEACRLVAYHGSADRPGVWSIGYGHTHGVKEGDVCTQAQAEEWLVDDIRWAELVVNAHVTVQLTQQEFDALVDFVFNVGSGNFTSSTMLKLLNEGDHHGAAQQFELWDHAGGVEVAGLLRRRQAEKSEFEGTSST